ncbi:MAG: C1 family peptidase [Saprospiraceae bacterium]|nr:C1 family peptidase [Saprospiraceae bacterium]MDW8485092.1 C1 family peptidase [Saprospiraceae bacterium]
MNYQKRLGLLIFVSFALLAHAQKPEPYEFKPVKILSASSVKDQQRTGTCWSFAAASLLESELMRTNKGAHDLSEMYTVRCIYRQKCENYVRRLGAAQFGQGGLIHDKLNAIQRYGLVPESVYPGRKDLNKPLDHGALEATLKRLCDTFIAQAKRNELADNWLAQIERVLDDEFGPVPTTFVYEGVQYTPTSFRDFLGIKPEHYVHLTSFTHHPFWTYFVLEIPDNFANGQYYNLPLNDLMRCLNHALQRGYTVAWDADISNPGFSAKEGLAIVPDVDWKNKTPEQVAAVFKYWEPEKVITQEMRQKAFDRLETQDDHLMHITGIVNETHGGLFYVVKNSWGEISERKGYLYASDAYVRMNTISLTMHVNALPPDILQRMRLFPVLEGRVEAPISGQTTPPAQTQLRPRPDNIPAPTESRLRNPNLQTAPAERYPLPKKATESPKEK